MRTSAITTFAGVLASLLTAPLSHGQVVRSNYDIVALQGTPSPSISATATYGILGGSPHIDATGHVSFGGFVGGNGAANFAVWTGMPGAISSLAVAGDPTPGRPGETLDVFALSSSSNYWPCSDGSVSFACRTKTSNDQGFWHGVPGTITPVVIVNDPPPLLPSSTVKNFPGPGMVANGTGAVLVRANFEGGGVTGSDDSGIWLWVAGETPQLVAREGSQAPGVEDGTTHDDFTFARMSMNGRGQVCFANGIRSGDLGTNKAIFAGPPDALAPVVRKGDAIPILPGFTWNAIGKPRINNRGDVAFEAVPKPDGAKSFFVRHADGTFVKIAEDGQPAPGAAGREWSGSFFNQPYLAGSFATFKGGLEESDSHGRDGIWIHEAGGATSLVAKSDDPAPGLPGQTFSTFDDPSLNALGMVAFKATTDLGTVGLWLYHGGTVRLLAAVGDFLTVGAGDSRRVASITFKGGSSSQSGYRSALNDAGQLVFGASFNSGGLGTALFHLGLCDLDRGGIGCVLEGAFGGDFDDPADDFAILPTPRRDGDEFVVTYLRRTDGSYIYSVQNAIGLTGWSAAPGSTALAADQSGLPPGFERVEFRQAITVGGSVAFRVEVVRS